MFACSSVCVHVCVLVCLLVGIWGWAICIGIHRVSAMDQEFSTSKNLIVPLKNWFFRLNTPGNFRDFLGDHFPRVESSGDQNLTMFILDFHVFFEYA